MDSRKQAARTIRNPVVGDELEFVKLASESGGEKTVIEVTLQPGGGAERHFHTSIVERFESLSGTLGVEADGKDLRLAEGESFAVIPHIAHRYFNPGADVIRFRVDITPGHRGFEQFLQIIYGLAVDGRTTSSGMPLNPLYTGVLLAMSDTNLPGAIRVFEPVVRLLGWIGRMVGVDQSLINRYCKIG